MAKNETMTSAVESAFDHLSPSFEADPFPVLAEMRQKCPVAHSSKYDGFWVVTRYAEIEQVIHDYERFSSRIVMIPRDLLIGFDGEPFSAPPLTSDPPFHTKFRKMLLPLFAPGEIRKWEAATREIAEELVANFAGRSDIDLALEYARIVPITVIARMMGVPEEDRDTFTDWIHRLFENGPDRVDVAGEAMIEMYQYLYAQIEARLEEQKDDLISLLMATEIDGEKLDENELLGSLIILLLAGIDTTWSTIGSCLHHLAQHPEDRQRLVAALDDSDPELWTSAVEEFLRAFAPVTIARVAKCDSDLGGEQVNEGDLVLVPYVSANHDPEAFDRADEIVLDRENNRHLAFGLGIHRCIGSNLARLEIRVALQTFLKSYPDFEVAPGTEVVYGGGQVRGPRTLQVRVIG